MSAIVGRKDPMRNDQHAQKDGGHPLRGRAGEYEDFITGSPSGGLATRESHKSAAESKAGGSACESNTPLPESDDRRF
jgi:hypothetical protein